MPNPHRPTATLTPVEVLGGKDAREAASEAMPDSDSPWEGGPEVRPKQEGKQAAKEESSWSQATTTERAAVVEAVDGGRDHQVHLVHQLRLQLLPLQLPQQQSQPRLHV